MENQEHHTNHLKNIREPLAGCGIDLENLENHGMIVVGNDIVKGSDCDIEKIKGTIRENFSKVCAPNSTTSSYVQQEMQKALKELDNLN
ncbi:Uncharacterized protein QTN25_006078 [Entamoeba marina]